MIQRHAHTPDLQSAVAATLRAVDVGSRLTGHLLRFAGRQPVRPQAVTPRLYLSESEELLKTVLGKRIQLSVSVAPETDRVLVDVSELELALINLALNASDAMPSGGQVWLHARNASDDEAAGLAPGPYVLITLSDNGVGCSRARSDSAARRPSRSRSRRRPWA
jgi:signal transduction histidine kinase